MSASSCPLSDEELFNLQCDINKAVWEYLAKIQTQLESMQKQSSYRLISLELNAVRSEIKMTKYNYEQNIRSVQDRISKVFKKRDIFSNVLFGSVQDTMKKIPGCLMQIQLDLEKIRLDYANTTIDEDFKNRLAELQAEESKFEKLLEIEVADSKNQEIIALKDKLHNVGRRRMDHYMEEFLQFFQEQKPELYAKYQLAYQYYLSRDMKDDRVCRGCNEYFKLNRLLISNLSEHQAPKCKAK